jgi:hypothetical protein
MTDSACQVRSGYLPSAISWSSAPGPGRYSLPSLRARDWLDRGRRPGRGLRRRGAVDPCGHLRRGPAAAVPGQRPGHAQPVGHPDQPAVQRGRNTGSPVPVLAAGAGRRPSRPGAHRRDPARRHRRIGHPRQGAARPSRLRSGGSRRPASARGLARCDSAIPPGPGVRPPGAANPGAGPDLGGRGGLRGRDLRDRRRLHPGPHPDRIGPASRRGRSRCPGLHVRDIGA